LVAADNEGFGVDSFYISLKSADEDPNPCYPPAYVLKRSCITVNSNEQDNLLELRLSKNNVSCGRDSGLGSNSDLTSFKPKLGPNQYWFGHHIVNANIEELLEDLPITTCTNKLIIAPPIGF
jgi:hypothetical protein